MRRSRARCRAAAAILLSLSAGRALPAAELTKPIASYEISCRLDTDRKAVEGTEKITWTNTTSKPARTLQFHLYLNAFRNTLSTLWKESQGAARAGERMPDSWGFVQISRMTGSDGTDLLPALTYIAPDDGNVNDRTVAEVVLPRPVLPGETATLSLDFRSQLPRVSRRTGYKGDFYLVAQWFPKLGVLEEAGWNCHQFHATSEFFSDFGNYDVSISVPARYRGKVGATGRLAEERQDAEGRLLYRFHADSVHDFAWTADPNYLVKEDFFREAGLHDVSIRLLLQPEHAAQADRHFKAARAALSGYGRVLGPYPYDTLTLVDPPWGARAAGGMEYPTLITCGTYWSAPRTVQSPEGVTIHELGHQFFYGLLASNEFEEPWLDEGFNSYMTARVLAATYGPNHPVLSVFGLRFPIGIDKQRPLDESRRYFAVATADYHAVPSWRFKSSTVYASLSYSKTTLVLATLERLLGTATMDRVLRLYADRWRFKHPKTRDWIAAVNDATGQDWTWFFDRTFFSSGGVDYAVEEAESKAAKPPRGRFDGDGKLVSEPPEALAKPKGFDSVVTVVRRGDVAMPVEIELRFEGTRPYRTKWDGEARWTRLRVEGGPRLIEAIVDPDEKILLDSDRTNNGRRTEADPRAAARWTSRSVFWVQNLLDFLTVAW
ncbi:MAG: M1 family metallopeptidase [Thermoanaerobaculia bacterium]